MGMKKMTALFATRGFLVMLVSTSFGDAPSLNLFPRLVESRVEGLCLVS